MKLAPPSIRPIAKLSPGRLKWLMRLYPPLLANGVRVLSIAPDYLQAVVRIRKTRLNTNFNGSVFGGTILCAIDPWFGILFWQALSSQGYAVRVVIRNVQVDFLHPATSSLLLNFQLYPTDLDNAKAALSSAGKFVETYAVQAVDKQGQVCAQANITVHMRLLAPMQESKVGI